MPSVAELCTTTLTEAAALIKSKAVSPVELTQAMLDRIEAIDGTLHSYITVTADFALEQARAAEQEILAGTYRGPLHGIPIAVKDLCFTKGIRTTCASKILADWVPDYNATDHGQTVRRRRGVAGQTGHDRVCPVRLSSLGRTAAQPVESRPLAGRVVERLRGCHGRLAVLWLARFGYRRLDPLSRLPRAALSASSRPTVGSAATACFRSARPSIMSGR